MIGTHSQTRAIVRSYFDAWTRGDMSTARKHFADDLAFSGSLKHLNSAAEYIATLNEYYSLVTTGNDLISELYGADEATLIYDSQTVAGTIRIAEHIRLTDGKISSILLILDPTALREFRAGTVTQ